MARCPACSKKIGIGDLIRQSAIASYRCVRCGRNWSFTNRTLVLSSAIALIPIVYIATLHYEGAGAAVLAFAEALLLSIIVYAVSLVIFGRLQTIRPRRR
jgi:DNA-directed RNA polymerase subunit RPC12/RpoP